jgi:hypothetical protein
MRDHWQLVPLIPNDDVRIGDVDETRYVHLLLLYLLLHVCFETRPK